MFKLNVVQKLQQNKRKIIETCIVLIIVGVLTIIAGGSLFKNESLEKKSKNVGEIIDNGNYVRDKNDVESQQKLTLEKKIEMILSSISGAGDVKVMVSFETTGEKEFAYDVKTTETSTEEKDKSGGERNQKEITNDKKTVFEENNGTKKPVIIKETEPNIKGIIITAEGAGNPVIKEQIKNAVIALYDIPAHRIAVYEKSKSGIVKR